MRLERIELTFRYRDSHGRSHDIGGVLDPEYGWQQWGQPRAVLSENVPLLESLSRSAFQDWPEESGEGA